MKTKHVLVVAFTSVIVAVVFVTTLVGYGLYMKWKEDSTSDWYNDAIYRLTADMFRKEIVLTNFNAYVPEEGQFKGVPLIEGSIRNNSTKSVASVMIEASFSRPDGSVVSRTRFYPLGRMRSTANGTKSVLLPGKAISFTHPMRSCPVELKSELSTKAGFARGESRIKADYKMAGLSVL